MIIFYLVKFFKKKINFLQIKFIFYMSLNIINILVKEKRKIFMNFTIFINKMKIINKIKQ
jgi:hypothetical protein